MQALNLGGLEATRKAFQKDRSGAKQEEYLRELNEVKFFDKQFEFESDGRVNKKLERESNRQKGRGQGMPDEKIPGLDGQANLGVKVEIYNQGEPIDKKNVKIVARLERMESKLADTVTG